MMIYLIYYEYDSLIVVNCQRKIIETELGYGDVGLIFGSLTSISPADRGQKILGVSLLPPPSCLT